MPVIERSVQAPNSLLLVMDSSAGRVPETMAGRLTASTESSVAIGTLSEADGPTTVRVLASAELGANAPPKTAWQGVLATPTGELIVASVDGEKYLTWPVAESTRLQILVNDDNEPDEIWIVVE